jgi:uncharacterized membrane protein
MSLVPVPFCSFLPSFLRLLLLFFLLLLWLFAAFPSELSLLCRTAASSSFSQTSVPLIHCCQALCLLFSWLSLLFLVSALPFLSSLVARFAAASASWVAVLLLCVLVVLCFALLLLLALIQRLLLLSFL